MEKDDVQLIHDILSGDHTAFTALVEKYQKSVHALVWQKIGDFHHAEEVTQDTFLQAYRNLSTLRNPNLFAGWLYTIANRLCIDWLRKQKPEMQSLVDPHIEDIVEKLSYTRYMVEQRETEAAEHYHEIVKQLLEKLPEKERAVVTLHYLDEMTTKEISDFLGVSENTIRSWLYRVRKRLREHLQEGEFHMTQEGRRELDQSTEELILKEFVPKMLGTIETKIHAELQGQLGKSIPDTQMLEQVLEKMMSDIKKKILAEIQAQLEKEFPKM